MILKWIEDLKKRCWIFKKVKFVRRKYVDYFVSTITIRRDRIYVSMLHIIEKYADTTNGIK